MLVEEAEAAANDNLCSINKELTDGTVRDVNNLLLSYLSTSNQNNTHLLSAAAVINWAKVSNACLAPYTDEDWTSTKVLSAVIEKVSMIFIICVNYSLYS